MEKNYNNQDNLKYLEISRWLDLYSIKSYTLVPDETYGYVINVAGNVDLTSMGLTKLPYKFNIVDGAFNCERNNLTSLEFCPISINGSFYCHQNELTSLKWIPEIINGDFCCHSNELISLEFCPREIHGRFLCSNNKIKDLVYFPNNVTNFTDIGDNKIDCMKDDVENRNYNFDEIYKIHLVHKVIDERQTMEKNIEPNQKNKKTIKV